MFVELIPRVTYDIAFVFTDEDSTAKCYWKKVAKEGSFDKVVALTFYLKK